jgi:F-type H+-transporting ATPase subunit b
LIELSWTFFFQIVNILILYLVLRRYLYKPVNDFIARRREHTEGLLKEANESFARAKQLQEQAEAQLNEARREAQALIEQAVETGKTMAAEIAEQVRAEEAARRERLEQEIEEAKNLAIQELRQEVASLSVKVAEKILEQNLSPQAHMQLIESVLERMDDTYVN